VPRMVAGADIHDAAAVTAQALRLASLDDVDTICLHGDTPGAAGLAAAVQGALRAAGVEVSSLASPPPARA
jgi:5-oxoprolinase (ATP-hydrolysing) subunit A